MCILKLLVLYLLVQNHGDAFLKVLLLDVVLYILLSVTVMPQGGESIDLFPVHEVYCFLSYIEPIILSTPYFDGLLALSSVAMSVPPVFGVGSGPSSLM